MAYVPVTHKHLLLLLISFADSLSFEFRNHRRTRLLIFIKFLLKLLVFEGSTGSMVQSINLLKQFIANTMDMYQSLLDGNRAWVKEKNQQDPGFFERLSKGQSPQVLWIGCSDSRVPANEVTGTKPGDIFVHRNIANMVIHSDMNLLSVLDYAVNALKVRHVIVCGHYGCGGVKAAMGNSQNGIVDNWLRHIKDVYRLHAEELDGIEDDERRFDRLVELNIMEQVFDLSKTSIIQNAWKDRNQPMVHGWVYDIRNGLIKDLGVSLGNAAELPSIYQIDSPVVVN
jgi:carbonic anhydrase